MAEINVQDHGAVGDGTIDDTSAIQDAIAVADPGDTLYFPTGSYLVNAFSQNPMFVFGSGDGDHGITVKGDGPTNSEVIADGGHTGNYVIFRWEQGYDHTGGGITDIELDGNYSGNDDSEINGWLAQMEGTTGNPEDFIIDNVLFNNSWSAAINITDSVRFKRCSFIDNGLGSATYGRNGHAVNILDGYPATAVTEVLDCEFDNNSGSLVNQDGEGRVEVRTAWGRFRGRATKYEENCDSALWQNVYLEGILSDQESGVFGTVNPTDGNDAGTLELQDVHVNGSQHPAVDYKGTVTGTLTGDNILLEDINQEGNRQPPCAIFLDPDDTEPAWTVDIGTLSVHNVNNVASTANEGYVFENRNTDGTVDDLRYSDVSGIGATDGTTITSSTADAAPISVDTPSRDEVGINSTPSSSSVSGRLGVSSNRYVVSGNSYVTTSNLPAGVSVIDDWEDGNWTGWSVENGNAFVTDTIDPYNGTVHGVSPTTAGAMASAPGDGLDNYFTAGETSKVYVQFPNALGEQIWVWWGLPTANDMLTNGYYLRYHDAPDEWRLWEEGGNSNNQIGNSLAAGAQIDTWYELEIQWDTGAPGDITVTVTEDPGGAGEALVGSIGPVTPTNYDHTGNEGIGFYKSGAQVEPVYVDWWHKL